MLGSVSEIDIRLLRVFMTVARCGGFAAAQSALNVTQANISMQMKQLEERLGMKLCHRGRSGFWLTEEGKSVLESSQALFRSLDEFRSSVAATSGKVFGRLHLSVVDNSIFNPNFYLHETIRAFKDVSTDSDLVLHVVATNEVEQMVLDGSCDIGIGFFPARRQGLEYAPLFSAEMNLYCGRGHPLFERAPDNLDVDNVLTEEHAARAYVSTTQLPSFERRFLVGGSAATVEGLATLALSGKYTTYLPCHYARHWVETDELRPILPDLLGYNCLYEFVTKPKANKSQLLDLFTEKLTSLHDDVADRGFQIGSEL